MDLTENVSSIIACSVISKEITCPQSCSLSMAVVLSLFTQSLLGNRSPCHNTYKLFVLQIELSPVDFVSRAIVEMSQDVLHSTGKVFHIINPCTMDLR
jgi:hypothetical protein